ncbi:MAG TPA: TRAM domain-containing protein [Kofleriaceae bacterium]
MSELEVEVTALAAGGDGVARDANGRVTFVPRSAPGDLVRVRLTKQTKSFARGELVEVVRPSTLRDAPPCEHFVAGCGGCQWQHVDRAAQLAAKRAIVTNALRNLPGLVVEDVLDPAPPYGWRRRARFHVHGGKVGLYHYGSRNLIAIAHCPQLEPALDAALKAIAPLTPPDGELALVLGHGGEIVVGVEHAWRGAAKVIGRAHIVGVVAGNDRHGETVIEIEPGLSGGPWDFAQASAAGNAALVEVTRRVLLGAGDPAGGDAASGDAASGGAADVGSGGAADVAPSVASRAAVATRGRVLELHAGAGNFTRGFVADGWTVTASDVIAPAKPIDKARFEIGAAEQVLARIAGPFDAIVLDPPRTGALEAMAGIVKHAPRVVVYVSCDPATLARDAAKLVEAGYRAERAWPVDLMPQTSHVEVVLRLVRDQST